MSERRWNWVDEAVLRAGGPTQAALLLRMSGGSIHRMKTDGRMPTDTEQARDRVHTLARMTEVTALQLVGLDRERPHPGPGDRLAEGSPRFEKIRTLVRTALDEGEVTIRAAHKGRPLKRFARRDSMLRGRRGLCAGIVRVRRVIDRPYLSPECLDCDDVKIILRLPTAPERTASAAF